MKIETKPAKFEPVHIILENQDEVNKMFAIFNFCPISNALKLPEKAWEQLEKLATDYEKYHDKLCEWSLK